METVTVTTDGDTRVVRLPKTCHLNAETVSVRQEGEAIVLEPVKPDVWPEGFFEEIHITDPAFERPTQGAPPPIKPEKSLSI